jgi:hypothetical protein
MDRLHQRLADLFVGDLDDLRHAGHESSPAGCKARPLENAYRIVSQPRGFCRERCNSGRSDTSVEDPS